MVRHLLATLIACLITGGLAPAAWAKVDVVATLPDLAAIAAEVGGEHVNVTALASEVQDPHYVDARPNLLLPLRDAEMLIVNGLELEAGWLPPLLTNSRNNKIQQGSAGYVDASTVVRKRDVKTPDRAKGDIHPGGNPHFTHDPQAALSVAAFIAKRLAAIDPAHAADYAKQAKRFDKKLRFVMAAETKRFAALPAAKRRIVAYHASLAYLNRWLGLTTVATVEPKPGIAPSPGHVAGVLRKMKAEGLKVIVQEQFYPRKTSQTLARLAGGKVALIPGGTRFAKGETYILRVRRAAKVIYDAIR